MISVRVSPVLSSVVVGVTIVATWVAWKYMKRRYYHSKPLYVAKKICIVNTSEQWEEAYIQLKKDLRIIKVLGLDCEWVEASKVALLQLASPSGLCVLVQLFKMQPYFPESLHLLLADNSILKVGVAIVDDGKRLHRDYGLSLHGCVDLRHVLKRVRAANRCPSRGLRGLANGILGVEINKDSSVRCGNWEADTYSQQQVEYAATDAAVAVDIFLSLVFTKMKMAAFGNHGFRNEKPSTHSQISNSSDSPLTLQENPGLTMETEGTLTSPQLSYPNTAVLCNNNANMASHHIQKNSELSSLDSLNKKTTNSGLISEESKGENPHSVIFLCLKNKLFPTQIFELLSDNEKDKIWKSARSLCQGVVEAAYIQYSQAHTMVMSDYVKAQSPFGVKDHQHKALPTSTWVANPSLHLLIAEAFWGSKKVPEENLPFEVQYNLFIRHLMGPDKDLICEDPLTVRLRFEPSNRPESERNYYLQEKKNICVVCGCDRDYVRKFIVPFEYRKYFPRALKDHSSHDVLLLCTACHRKSSDSDVILRLQLAEECNAPLDSGETSRTFFDHELQKVRSSGRALLTSKHCMPEERIIALKKVLQDFYGVDSVTEDLVKQAAATTAKQIAENYIPHGKKVVDHMANNGGLLTFQSRWRQHFLDTMNPQYLPDFWSVEFVPEAWSLSHRV